MKQKTIRNERRYDWRNVMKSKLCLSLMVLGLFVVLSTGVLAYYLFSYSSTTIYTIQGGETELIIVQQLEDQLFSVNETQSISQNLTIDNKNSFINMTYNMTISTNVTDLNCSGDNDVSFVLSKTGLGDLTPDQTFSMNEGINDFVLKASVENKRTCPQNIDIQIEFTE